MRAYLITNLEDGNGYVGITRVELAKRWAQHVRRARKGGKSMLSKAIRRFGAGRFSIEEVGTAPDWQLLCALEVSLIAKFGTFVEGGRGYNHTIGGDGGATVTGRRHSPETLAKMRAFPRKGQGLGNRHSPAAIENMRRAQKGHESSPERNAKIAASLTGKPNGWLGRRHSEATKLKISETKKGRKDAK